MLIEATDERWHDWKPWLSDSDHILTCDETGPDLYGHVIPTPVASISEALDATIAECPSEVAPKIYTGGEVKELVGRDFYPARVMCDYDTTTTFECGPYVHDYGSL